MDITGEYTFDAPRDSVWAALRDPEVLAIIMPGGEELTETAENAYVGILNIKVGPVRGKFKGEVKLKDIQEPEGYTLLVDGKGAPGFVKATGNIKLEDQGEKTKMEYSGTAQIGGRIASVGQRLIDTSARSIIRQSLEGLNDYLLQKMAHEAAVKEAEAEAVGDGDAVEAEPAEAEQAEAKASEPMAEAPAKASAPREPQASEAEPEEAEGRQGRDIEPPPHSEEVETKEAKAKPKKKAKVPEFEYKAPTQAELARNVAKDVMNEMIPAPLRIAIVVAVVVVTVLLVWYMMQ